MPVGDCNKEHQTCYVFSLFWEPVCYHQGEVRVLEQTLGRTLQGQRKARGLTIQALAAQAGVHRTTVSRWERGEAVPFVHELTRVLDILNVSLKERQGYYQSVVKIPTFGAAIR